MSISPTDSQKFGVLTILQTLNKSLETQLSDSATIISLRDQYNLCLSTVASFDANVTGLLKPIDDTVWSYNKDSVLRELRMRTKALESYVSSMLIPMFFQLMPTLSSLGLIQKTNPFAGLTDIAPVLEKLGLTPNWLVAATSLALFELLVNKGCDKLGLESSGDYNDKVARLANALGKQRVKFPELMVSALRQVRNKVLHEGKEPTQGELNDITRYLREISQILFQP